MVLFIIFGTRGVTYTKDRGSFHCPVCSDKKAYAHKRVRRFFTLYFIPVIPLDLLGEYIECQRCRGTYKEQVLDFDPGAGAAEMEAEFQKAIKRVMVDMMMADGVIDDSEIETIKEIYGQVAGREIPESSVRKEIQRAEKDGIEHTIAFLEEMQGCLNDNGKELVMRAAIAVAAADGTFQDEEKGLMIAYASALGMTPTHLKGLLTDLTEAA